MRKQFLVACSLSTMLGGGFLLPAAADESKDEGWPVALPTNTAETLAGNCQFYVDPNATELATFLGKKGNQNSAYTGQRYGNEAGTFSATDFLFDRILSEKRDFYNPLGADGEARAGGPNDFAANPGPRDLEVKYHSFNILDCDARLRQYALAGVDKTLPFGPTFSFEPGDTLSLNIVNQLPTDKETNHHGHSAHAGHNTGAAMHDLSADNSHGGSPVFSSELGYLPEFDPQIPNAGTVHNLIHDLNHTNIHTHGWHVNPRGNGDNVFVNIVPGGTKATAASCTGDDALDCYHEQRVQLPPIGPKGNPTDPNEKDHPGGTFWYHAHVHGATAVQVTSGMAGGLIVRDAPGLGLDAALADANVEDIFLGLQQMPYDDQGRVEGIQFIQESSRQTAAVCDGGANLANRPRLINGVAVPTIEMDVDQLYRLRFLHSGSIGQIQPQILTFAQTGLGALQPTNGQGSFKKHGAAGSNFPLYEIETDGLPTGNIIAKSMLSLQPAYRSAALFQIDRTYWASQGRPSRLYLVDATKGATTAPTQCVRDADGNLVLQNGVPQTASPTIASLRYVMAIIEITDSGLREQSLRDAYINETKSLRAPFKDALASYQSQDWNADGALDPFDEFGYAGISPLPFISDAELAASQKSISVDDGVIEVDFSQDPPVERVHYYGDGPANGSVTYSNGDVFRAANTTDYYCPDTGGRCTYCGGSVAEAVGLDGKTYNVLTERSTLPECGPASTAKAIAHGTNANTSDAYAAENRLPWVNFMICDSIVDSDLALDTMKKVSVSNGKTKNVPSIFDANGKRAKGVTGENFAGVTGKVWSCMKFNETSEMARWVGLNTANEWEVSSKGGKANHVFHIHVNPFQMTEPTAGKKDALGKWVPGQMQVWKDTYGAPPVGGNVAIGTGTVLKTRYTKFSGAFVQHCHILTHEDQGMMQVVSVEDRTLVARLMDLTGADTATELRQSFGVEIGAALEADDRTAGPDLLTLNDLLPELPY